MPSLDNSIPWFSYSHVSKRSLNCRRGRTLNAGVTSEEVPTETHPLFSFSVCAEMTPLPCSTTKRLPALSRRIPRGLDRPVATTCMPYPDAREGRMEPDGAGPQLEDDCAAAECSRRPISVATMAENVFIFSSRLTQQTDQRHIQFLG